MLDPFSKNSQKIGQMLAVVTKTGALTYIGRAASLMSQTHEAGHFQQIVNSIGNFLIIISVVCFLRFICSECQTPNICD
jgi:H+-transporting ATPase